MGQRRDRHEARHVWGIEVALPFSEPILACGAHLKNAICVGSGDTAFLGPHIGDRHRSGPCSPSSTSVGN